MSLIEKALMKSQKEAESKSPGISPVGQEVLGNSRGASGRRILLGVCLVLVVCVAGAWLLIEWLPLFRETVSTRPARQEVQGEMAQRPRRSLEVGPGSTDQQAKRPEAEASGVPQRAALVPEGPQGSAATETDERSKKDGFFFPHPVSEGKVRIQGPQSKDDTSRERDRKSLKQSTSQSLEVAGSKRVPSEQKEGTSPQGPTNRDILLEKAFISAQLGHYSEALKAYDELIRSNPKDVDARINRAILKSRLGDVFSAKEDLMVAREVKPDDPALLNALGVIHMERGELDEALQWFLRCPDPISIINSALVYWRKGQEEQALKFFSEAEVRLPEEPRIPYYRALLLKEMGRIRESAKEIQKARTLARKKGDMEVLRQVDELSVSP